MFSRLQICHSEAWQLEVTGRPVASSIAASLVMVGQRGQVMWAATAAGASLARATVSRYTS